MINTYPLHDGTVEVPLCRYDELLIKAQRYDDLVAAAVSKADLGWGDEIRLDRDAVEDFLKVVESDRVTTMESKLKAEKEARLAQAQEEAE